MSITIILLATIIVSVAATFLEERFGRDDDIGDYQDWGGFDYWN